MTERRRAAAIDNIGPWHFVGPKCMLASWGQTAADGQASESVWTKLGDRTEKPAALQMPYGEILGTVAIMVLDTYIYIYINAKLLAEDYYAMEIPSGDPQPPGNAIGSLATISTYVIQEDFLS
ncbi:hypothetical protein PAAG_05268 [Paracoccidioides lutzii Pb01]|uniref:Uncharacterized protein n=1 Tax=Paracoccidioides lutzii (strain ATCC MYA-826 / Pb01) TaxID=502779 RepID=C1H3C5_PARBA|nr:hypothetical protein PAAG_05268 [Paracoccidioides lutzii Pb01]EEH34219.2 hypothetical protein PAAG_05268 [Paracoccidioides lutzii Pb01]